MFKNQIEITLDPYKIIYSFAHNHTSVYLLNDEKIISGDSAHFITNYCPIGKDLKNILNAFKSQQLL